MIIFHQQEVGSDIAETFMGETATAGAIESSSFEHLLASDGFFDVINVGVNISKGELLLLIMKYCIEHNLSQTAISDLLKLINMIFHKNILPDSRYFIDKLFNKSDYVEYHAVCPKCNSYLGTYDRRSMRPENKSCEVCQTTVVVNDSTFKNFFIIMNPASEIKALLEANETYYNHVVNERIYEKGVYKDIYDGGEYRKLIKTVQNDSKNSYATISFNSDGSPVFESSTYAIWPIQIMVNELPFDVRTRNLITCGLWFGKTKPNMNIFLKPFVNIMNELTQSGIMCKTRDSVKCVKIYSILCCVDSVARAPMQGLTQFNGRYGCSWCLHPGEWVRNKTGKSGGSLKYVSLDPLPEKRDDATFIQNMVESITTEQSVYGVKNTTPLINFTTFKVIRGFVPDPMHCIDLGIGKQFTTLFLKSLSATQVEYIDNVLLNLKYPRALTHLTRSLKEISYWKSKDWQNWILYSSVPVLRLVLEKKETSTLGTICRSNLYTVANNYCKIKS